MNDAMFAVCEFHRTMGLTIGDPAHPDISREHELRIELIAEEFGELKDALAANDMIGVADALADLAYVTAGAAVAWGIDLGSVFSEVHASNMTKTPGLKSITGKLQKGESYVPPDIAGALKRGAEEVTDLGYGEDSFWPEPT